MGNKALVLQPRCVVWGSARHSRPYPALTKAGEEAASQSTRTRPAGAPLGVVGPGDHILLLLGNTTRFGAGPAPESCSHPGGMCSHFPAPCTTPSPVTPPGIQGEQRSGTLGWIRGLQRAPGEPQGPGAGDGGESSTPTCWLRSLPTAARHTEPPQLLLATKGCWWPVASKSPAAASLLLGPAQMLEAVKILINHK